jgi:hypothetical protein
MSFVGGGSDLPAYYRRFGGAVVSTAINKFVYITVNEKFDDRIRVSYSKTEEANSVGRVKHPLVREALTMLNDATELLRRAPFLVFAPGIAIVISAIGFNLLGDGLRESLDPRLKR